MHAASEGELARLGDSGVGFPGILGIDRPNRLGTIHGLNLVTRQRDRLWIRPFGRRTFGRLGRLNRAHSQKVSVGDCESNPMLSATRAAITFSSIGIRRYAHRKVAFPGAKPASRNSWPRCSAMFSDGERSRKSSSEVWGLLRS
jgi:hypothetical protein